jgi:hypothetical protein
MAETVSARQLLFKQPAERLYYSMDFSERIATTVIISAIEVTSTLLSGAVSDLTIEEEVIDGEEVKFFISGGTHGKTYRVEVEATLTNDEVIIGAGMLKVMDR